MVFEKKSIVDRGFWILLAESTTTHHKSLLAVAVLVEHDFFGVVSLLVTGILVLLLIEHAGNEDQHGGNADAGIRHIEGRPPAAAARRR